MNIFVANLEYSVQEDELKALFEGHGQVDSVTIIKDKFSGRSKGFGFVEMPNDEEAVAAIEALNESDNKGRNMVVKKARPKDE